MWCPCRSTKWLSHICTWGVSVGLLYPNLLGNGMAGSDKCFLCIDKTRGKRRILFSSLMGVWLHPRRLRLPILVTLRREIKKYLTRRINILNESWPYRSWYESNRFCHSLVDVQNIKTNGRQRDFIFLFSGFAIFRRIQSEPFFFRTMLSTHTRCMTVGNFLWLFVCLLAGEG